MHFPNPKMTNSMDGLVDCKLLHYGRNSKMGSISCNSSIPHHPTKLKGKMEKEEK